MKHLPIDICDWEFVTREKKPDGTPVIFRCGRDFLYHALHYYHPQTFNKASGGPEALETALCNRTVPTFLLFTAWHLRNLPTLLQEHKLLLCINSQPVRTWWQLLRQMYRKNVVQPGDLDSAITDSVARGTVVGIDISIKWFGLVDHVLFVYGYDDSNYYVIDTLQLKQLPYSKLTNNPETFYMKLPKQAVYARLRPISRIWTVEPETRTI